jgi:hypothetical protein
MRRTFCSARNPSFLSLNVWSFFCSLYFPSMQTNWTLHFRFDNFVFFAHVLTINLPETFSVNPNPKSLACEVFVTYSSGLLLLASDSLFG